jgi:hypothetical protein
MEEDAQKITKEIVIPREQAVFRLDANGCWHNEGGRFRHKKIIDFFHASIRRDEAGYHLCQVRGDIREKVYFPYEDTALFVFDVLQPQGDAVTLVLNTGTRISLDPTTLFVRDDQLYLTHGDDRVKFTERSLIKLSERIGFQDGRYTLRLGGREHVIPQRAEESAIRGG